MNALPFLMVLLLSAAVDAPGAPDAPQALPAGMKPDAAKGDAGKPDANKPDFPPFDDVMKDFKEVPSKTGEGCYLTLYRNEKTDELRAVIPSSMLSKQFLLASSISGGPVATGFQLDHFLAYWERMDKNLVLMRVDARFEPASGKEVSDVVNRSYRDEILRTASILTLKGSDPVISLDGLFKADFGGIGGWFGGSINPSLSKWSSVKSFPQNVELTVEAAFMSGGSGGQRMPLHYSISSVPQSDYKPRVADPRVGYFMTVRKDWGKRHSEKTLFDRYVNRWNLQKRDPSLEKSPPKVPITWYIEKTVPVRFRHAVKQGILEWNKAFEKCGFLDAVVVLQQEENGAYDELDPEDVRYNFFRWIVTGRGFAMGPSRDHPLTGEIFDADIVFDDSMVRYYVTDYERFSGGGAPSAITRNPVMERFFKAFPQWKFSTPWERLLPNLTLQQDRDAEFYSHLQEAMAERGRPLCDYCAGKASQMAMAGATFAAQGKNELPQEFLDQVVKEIVMHEVGHCLGLRHNFKASTWLELQQITGSDGDGVATVGSVMDYNAETMPMRGEKLSSYITRSIGPYDYWAIEYGYRPVGEPYKSEEEMLKAITARSAEDGLQYATDEDTMDVFSPDPLANRFDMGKDVIDYAQRQIELTNKLLADVSDWAVKDGESYNRLRRTFSRLSYERGRDCYFVARFVGGQYMNRSHKGDKDFKAPIVPVSAEKQRAALKFVSDHLFARGVFKFDPKLLNSLAPGRYWHWDSDEFDFRTEFNIHDLVSGMQFDSLFALMNPFTINRVHENQIKTGDGEPVYTLAEHLRTINDDIWTELDEKGGEFTDGKPMIDSFRRNLQRMHLDLMLNYVLEKPGASVPADCNSIARMLLKDTSTKIAALGTDKVDTATRAHLSDARNQIDRALEAQYTLSANNNGGGMMMFFRPTGAPVPPETVLPNR